MRRQRLRLLVGMQVICQNICLKYNIWAKITNDKYVLEDTTGYRIPFKSNPILTNIKPNPKFSLAEEGFIKTELARLRSIGAVAQCEEVEGQFTSSIFVVPKPNGSYRLILNLKELNEYVDCPHFKMEDYRTV
jgi:hypothetical protein